MTYYYVESKSENDNPKIVGHSQDKKTKQIYYKFIDKSKAKKLLKDEKEVEPKLKYRIVKIIQRVEIGAWQ